MKLLYFISVLVALTYIECATETGYVIYDLRKAADLFAKFRHDYGKSYCTPEEAKHRFEVFKNNLKEINKINSKHMSWYADINQFADLTTEEVQKCCMGFKPHKKLKDLSYKPRARMVILDSSLDSSSVSG